MKTAALTTRRAQLVMNTTKLMENSMMVSVALIGVPRANAGLLQLAVSAGEKSIERYLISL